jgi:pyruvate dehydrogenase E1 component
VAVALDDPQRQPRIGPKVDGIKVGGHQASSASMVSIMTALYFSALKPEDRVAVKPHASPVFHAIQYLMGQQTREKMEELPRLRRRSILSVADQGHR